MELIEKVKKALIDSGFPLEMRMAQVLRGRDWKVDVGQRYVDFETGILREIDIVATKPINGIEVHLIVECKKSDNKQLVLYAPTHNRHKFNFLSPLRVFPKVRFGDKRFAHTWDLLPMFDGDIPISNNIVFTKGEKVEQNNDSFFSSLGSIIKKSIDLGSDGYIETGFRMMFLHLLVYDGVIYQVKDDALADFSIAESQYGQYEFAYRFKFPEAPTPVPDDIRKTAGLFSFSNIIEIMQPDYLNSYLEQLQRGIAAIPKKEFRNWGTSMEAYIKKKIRPTSTPENKPGKTKGQKKAPKA